MLHSSKRAEERFYIENLKTNVILNDIANDRCEQVKYDADRFSHIFIVRYLNKYIRVVTDCNISFVKTVLPLKNDFELINRLIKKLSTNNMQAA